MSFIPVLHEPGQPGAAIPNTHNKLSCCINLPPPIPTPRKFSIKFVISINLIVKIYQGN